MLGFRQYLRTAEAEQLRFEERADIFSRYLPYAVVFGETDRWAKAFSSLADDPRTAPRWPGTAARSGWNFASFGDSMESFSAPRRDDDRDHGVVGWVRLRWGRVVRRRLRRRGRRVLVAAVILYLVL